MKMELFLQQKMEQRLLLAPQIIQSIEILQLPLIELDQLIRDELEENPTLEILESGPVENEGDKGPEATGDERPSMAEEWPEGFGRGRGHLLGEKDRKMEAMQNTAARPVSLQEALYGQFRLLEITAAERGIGETIIFNIDGRGYLPYALDEIFDFDGGDVSRAAAGRVLAMVQGLEPAGVGGRDLEEVLLLQLDPNDPNLPAMERLITGHLDDLLNNRLPRVCRATGFPMEELKRLVERIGLLHPRPGTLHGDEEPRYIVPDVVVERIDDAYVIRLEKDFLPTLRISQTYRDLLRDKSSDANTRRFIKGKMEAARWLIESIVQRQNTLFRVAEEIFRVQRPFLDHGPSRLLPMKMQGVADALGIHVSTVSRAISQKYAQTHRGIFRLKDFFTGATATSAGKDLSRTTVKMRVREIVGKEDRSKPLSDEDIGAVLSREGLDVARRTVTKYRKELRIASSRRRKVY